MSWQAQDGAIPFVLVGVVALGGVLGVAWTGNEWSQRLLGEAGGELTVWVLRGAFWALDLVALQASMSPVNTDWYTPVLTGPALPLYALAGVVMVATLLAEVLTGMVQGNTLRIVQAVFRALLAGMLAAVGATVLLSVAGALSEVGRAALAASGTTVDAPLIPLQEVLMEATEDRDTAGVELFIAFLAAVVIVFTSVSIYFILAMRPVVLAAIIVFLPIAHALSVWEPLRRVQLRLWSVAVAVLLAEAAILTMFAVANTAMGQPDGVDRLIFGTFGLLLAALAPAALARIVGAPELHSAVSTMSRGSKTLAIGGGLLAAKGATAAVRGGGGRALAAGGSAGSSALESSSPPPAGGGGTAAAGPTGGGGGGGGGAPSSPGGNTGPSGGSGTPVGGSGGGRAAGAGDGGGARPAGSAGSTSSAGSPSSASSAGSVGSAPGRPGSRAGFVAATGSGTTGSGTGVAVTAGAGQGSTAAAGAGPAMPTGVRPDRPGGGRSARRVQAGADATSAGQSGRSPTAAGWQGALQAPRGEVTGE